MSAPESFITLATFNLPVEAHLAKAKLESEGIEARIGDENIVSINWLYSNAVGGVKLQVPASQAERARQILQAVEPPSGEAVVMMPCPKCHAPAVAAEGVLSPWQRFLTFLFMLFGSPRPLHRTWKCRKCGHTVTE